MQLAKFVTLTLARFDTIQNVGEENVYSSESMFATVGVDVRAAGTSAASRQGYKFCIVALHATMDAAQADFDERNRSHPWLSEAREIWSTILQPIRHIGAVNYLDPQNPGLVYDCAAEAVPEGPLVVLTTAGFIQAEGWLENARAFSEGVTAVRIAMTGVTGLFSQQTFNLDNSDGLTVTVWDDFSSVRGFAYGPGVHKDNMTRHKSGGYGDRTSFARCKVLRSEGAWHGTEVFRTLS